MSNRGCSGKCVGGQSRGAARPSQIPRRQPQPRPISAGSAVSRSRIPQPQFSRAGAGPCGQGRLPIMPPPPRPRSALPVLRRPAGQGAVRRAQPIQAPIQRPRPGPLSRIPCPRLRSRERNEQQPSVIVNTRLPRIGGSGQRSTDININIKLQIEPLSDDAEARDLQEFELLEQEMQELEEYERLERQCQMACSNNGGAQVFDVVPLTPQQQTGRPNRNWRQFIEDQRVVTGSGGARRLQDRFGEVSTPPGTYPDITNFSPPEFTSPMALSDSGPAWAEATQAGTYQNISNFSPPAFSSPPMTHAELMALSDSGPAWNSLANQCGSMLADESMVDDSFDGAAWDGSYNSEGWRQLVAAADDASDLGNVSMNFESPGCC